MELIEEYPIGTLLYARFVIQLQASSKHQKS